MEGKHFDQLIKHMGTGVGRRHILGGLIGSTAALLTGTAVIKAKSVFQNPFEARGASISACRKRLRHARVDPSLVR